MIVNRSKWKPLSPCMEAAIDEFTNWSTENLNARDKRNKIRAPLYHYTDAAGLNGIIKDQQLWLTDYRHLNDPHEVIYGMDMASSLLKDIKSNYHSFTGIFCDMVNELLTHRQLQDRLIFFIGSLTRNPDELGQWRAYGDNGRGFALGLAPGLFHLADKSEFKPHEKALVTPVVYGDTDGRLRHRSSIEKAAQIVQKVVNNNGAIEDKDLLEPFFDRMAKALIASQIILNSLSIKHGAYKNEKEVRLIITGDSQILSPYTSTRTGPGGIIPFIKYSIPIQANGNVADVFLGPAAEDRARHGVRTLLRSFISDPDPLIKHSTIPYRLSR